jgi:hypothetical protein
MLASITPLGERGRHSRWALTVTAYLGGSVAAGAAFGSALGLAGQLLPAGTRDGRLLVFAAAAILGLVMDARIGGLRLPTVTRQVDENWLGRYRGWVYGGGFGVQLGLGVVTIVTTSTVYLTFLLALLSGSAAVGGLLGAVYGGIRALPILALRGVHSPEQLRAAHRRLQAGAPAAARATYLVLAGCAAGAAVTGGLG